MIEKKNMLETDKVIIILIHRHFVYFSIQLLCSICIQHYFQQMMNWVQENWNSNIALLHIFITILLCHDYNIVHETWINILQKYMHNDKY